MVKKVDFPDPEGPIIAINSPASTEKLVSFSASMVLDPSLNDFLTCFNVNTDIPSPF